MPGQFHDNLCGNTCPNSECTKCSSSGMHRDLRVFGYLVCNGLTIPMFCPCDKLIYARSFTDMF